MIDYEQARARVAAEVGPEWDRPGTFDTSPQGLADADGYAVPFGAQEWLVGRDSDFMVADDRTALVDRQTGVVTVTTRLLVMDRLAGMGPTA